MDLKNFKLIIGVSGGPDSMFLLNRLIKTKNYKDIIVCHVNYNYRTDSMKDQEVVENYCKENDIKYKTLSVEHKSGNFEAWARTVRYNFFVKEIKINNFDKIAIAHNLNDSVETFIMQTARNNIVDYYGINKIGNYLGVEVVRPILNLKKSYILKELKKENITYAIDSTNDDEKFLRNKIRKTIKDEDLDTLKREAELRNIAIINFQTQYSDLYSSNSFDNKIFKQMNEVEINRFVFYWIKYNDHTNSVMKKKKKFIKEVAKQLKSEKNLEIITDIIKIIKIKTIVSFIMVN